jgi:Reverse transcriptase (RNA-dependent DNA polymerase)
MPINYRYTYQRRGKHVFVPNDECIRRGEELIKFCSTLELPSYFYHYRKGGHVAALHQHRENRLFFRIDIKNFFYAIARHRVATALHATRFKEAREYAKWSCVKNPYKTPAYALPIGFVQSPLLASLAFLRAPLAKAIKGVVTSGVFISVYFDDLIGSSSDSKAIEKAYTVILNACIESNFPTNKVKLVPPERAIVAFNCDLTQGASTVTKDRVAEFYKEDHTDASISSFEYYRTRVAS